jgi:hypothetical protein
VPSAVPTFLPTISPTKYLEWFQVGSDLDGDVAGDNFGSRVVLSKDGTRLAVGSPESDVLLTDVGKVSIFEYDSGADSWNKLGGDIIGEGSGDKSGSALALSSDGSRVAIGADKNDDAGANAGHVRVFDYVAGTDSWVQVGADINGEAEIDLFGRSVALSDDGNRLAAGATMNDGNGANSGHVRVYDYDGSSWVQVGGDIDGEAASDQSGISVSLSADGSIVAIGAFLNDGASGADSGHTRVYTYSGGSGTWIQQGQDIDGEIAGDRSGYRVALSDDGSRLAVSSHLHDSNRGEVRVFEYQAVSSAWILLGAAIPGEAMNDLSGWSLSLSGNGKRLAIGAQGNDGGGTDSGHVRVYEYVTETLSWSQLGSDLDGEGAGDWSGISLSLSRDGKRLAIGAPLNDGPGQNAGHVRVY